MSAKMTLPGDSRRFVEEAFADRSLLESAPHKSAILMAVHQLDEGAHRVATPPEKSGGEWTVNAWLKQAILLYFALRKMEKLEVGPFEYFDKIPLKRNLEAAGVRVVPPGVVRYGAFLERGVIVM
ncbi:MAG: 2,3,4,5-tetrahydropyridine-2,6-dicarboxylate N-succinyltransferase, partial [Polyangiaceae bacterium]